MSAPDDDPPEEIVWQGKYLTVRKRGRWEYVGRARGIKAVAILAVHEGHIILVEQYRVPVGGRSLELPAGLVGDDEESEVVDVAATRELEEETGFRAARMTVLQTFYASPGMVSESFTLARAEGLTKTGQGGGIAGEDIEVHRVPLDSIAQFIAAKQASGVALDVKLLLLLGAGLLDGAE